MDTSVSMHSGDEVVYADAIEVVDFVLVIVEYIVTVGAI